MESKKYEILKDDSKTIDGIKVYRIKALKDFGIVSKGTLGGYIEKDTNLSQKGNCWIFENSIVYGDSAIMDDVLVYDSKLKSIIANDSIILNNELYSKNTDIYNSISNLMELYTQFNNILNNPNWLSSTNPIAYPTPYRIGDPLNMNNTTNIK